MRTNRTLRSLSEPRSFVTPWLARFAKCTLVPFIFMALSLSACDLSQPTSSEIWFTKRLTDHSEVIAFDPNTSKSRVVIQVKEGFIEKVAFSPNDDYLAYIIATNEGRAIWVSNSDGTKFYQITPVALKALFVWLNNNQVLAAITDQKYQRADQGKWILYDVESKVMRTLEAEENVELFCIGATDGLPVDLKLNQLSFFREGELIEYGYLKFQDNKVTRTIRTQVDLSKMPSSKGDICTFATFGVSQVAFIWYSTEITAEIGITSSSNQPAQKLTSFGEQYRQSVMRSISVSPNQQWLVFAAILAEAKREGQPTGELVGRINLKDRKLEILQTQPFERGILNFTWSPDSRYVAIDLPTQDSTSGASEVYIISMETKKVEQLTHDGFPKRVFDWN